MNGKKWVWIRATRRDGWRPVSFEDLYRIVVALVHCENLSYADRVAHRPSDMLRAVLADAIDFADGHGIKLPSTRELDERWRQGASRWAMPERAFAPYVDRWAHLQVKLCFEGPDDEARVELSAIEKKIADARDELARLTGQLEERRRELAFERSKIVQAMVCPLPFINAGAK